METKVLVTYASKYGSTAEIAEKIGQVLTQAGLPAEVSSVNLTTDLTPYRAVIIGSAVYTGQWRKEAIKFLETNEKLLAERAVWLFSCGPTGRGDPVQLTNGWRFPEAQRPIVDRIKPRDIVLFHGVVDMNKLNLLEKYAIRNVRAPVGDFRDWEAINSWAASIASELEKIGYPN